MTLPWHVPVQLFTIWHPRYHDRTVLLAKYKIGFHNVILFPNAKSMPGEWYISGSNAKQFGTMPLKTKTGGYMDCYEIPIDALEPFFREEDI